MQDEKSWLVKGIKHSCGAGEPLKGLKQGGVKIRLASECSVQQISKCCLFIYYLFFLLHWKLMYKLSLSTFLWIFFSMFEFAYVFSTKS